MKKLNNLYCIPKNYFNPKLKYFVYNHDIFHAKPFFVIRLLKMQIFEDWIWNYFHKNYPNSKLFDWLTTKRTWCDVKFVTQDFLTFGYRRFRFFGKILIYVEDCFFNNENITFELVQQQIYEEMDRDWNFRNNRWYELNVVYPLPCVFYVHAFAPANAYEANDISNWDIQVDYIKHYQSSSNVKNNSNS